jgi:hypothetical protein
LKKVNGYTVLFGFGLLLIVILATLQRNQQNYKETWYSKSKQPFGGYVLHQFLADYTTHPAQSVFQSLEKTAAQGGLQGTVLLVGHNLDLSPADWQVLKAHLAQGNTALLAGQSLGPNLPDTLGLRIEPFNEQWYRSRTLQELLELEVGLRYQKPINFPEQINRVSAKAAGLQLATQDLPLVPNYPFEKLAVNEADREILRRYTIGEGQLLVCPNPLLLSNYFLRQPNSLRFSQGLLSLLPQGPVQHFEFYELGALESGSPLRSLLNYPALKMALYLTLAGLVVLFVLGSKRKQRAIAIVTPPQNQSIQFVKTLAALHYGTQNYRSLYFKRLSFLKDYVYQHYRIRLQADDNTTWENLAAKSTATPKLIAALKQLFKPIQSQISEAQLKYQEEVVTEFYKL